MKNKFTGPTLYLKERLILQVCCETFKPVSKRLCLLSENTLP